MKQDKSGKWDRILSVEAYRYTIWKLSRRHGGLS